VTPISDMVFHLPSLEQCLKFAFHYTLFASEAGFADFPFLEQI
jgi:hypothetical protein